ncbi:phosphoribosylaminoimidazole carboxylase ade2 [Spiromyces aspiralis]|uniref:Phosphoribosylaminoimidazole carboxylase ade2 n=1 Tax=Spiromyces aspiralis TaxID=68401 RepID=A0ACC1HHL0_9FUNG|nr:phosphoribosylaminoimidazole carboxylase ade2 [Spiromyces aspiralis]
MASITKVGVLGGGQLGRMLIEAAHRLNISVVSLDPNENSPAKQLSNQPHHHGSFKDSEAVKRLAQEVDLLTVEIEHVDTEALRQFNVQPTAKTIEIIQDKYLQKVHLEASGVPLPEFESLSSLADAEKVGERFGYPFLLKCRKGAYDGRGNYVVRSRDDLADGWAALGGAMLYAEKFAPFTKELAVMVVRSVTGEVATYPVVETVQRDNICHLVYAPAQISGLTAERAADVARAAIQSFDGAGVYGVELFLTPNGILVNEIAPRPHNSGHYTIDACHTSQFENHLRAILGLPLGSTDLKVPAAIMVNLLGPDYLELTKRSLSVPGATAHLYGKDSAKVGRKMGHITLVGDSFSEVQNRVARIASDIQVVEPRPLVGIIMGSDSDLPTMKPAAVILEQMGVPFELTIVSAHRTPMRMVEYAKTARRRGLKVIIAGAGGAAHLPGMVAAMTPLPVIGVPVKGRTLDGVDSLHSIVQMPRGVPVATVAINNADNAALLAVRILGSSIPSYLDAMEKYMDEMEQGVHAKVDRLDKVGWKEYQTA